MSQKSITPGDLYTFAVVLDLDLFSLLLAWGELEG